MDLLLQKITILAIPVLLAITIHEYAHAWVANRLGDPTARLLGRLTLNPLKHLDPVGTVVFFLTGMIGWAKPVPVNALKFRDPTRDMMWTALAGPLTNLFLAALSAVFLRVIILSGWLGIPALSFIVKPIYLMTHVSIVINVALAIFNVIPVPPLDGSKILAGILPYRQSIAFSKMEPYGFVILIALLFTGMIHSVISPIVAHIVALLLGGSYL